MSGCQVLHDQTPTSKIEEIYRGDIFMVDFKEGEGASVHIGKRPCIVVSNNVGNKYSPIINVVMLTTKQRSKPLPTHVTIQPDGRNQLKQTSFAMCEQIRTIGKDALRFKVGTLSRDDIGRLDYTLGKTLGLKLAKKERPSVPAKDSE